MTQTLTLMGKHFHENITGFGRNVVPLQIIMKKEEKSPVYGRDVMELVTVAVEYCAFLEQTEGKTRMNFVDTLMKLLPLLYLKAALLPKYEILDGDYMAEEPWCLYKGRELKPEIKQGYEYIQLYDSPITKHFAIHRLVATAFIPNPKNKPCVNHKNGIRHDINDIFASVVS